MWAAVGELYSIHVVLVFGAFIALWSIGIVIRDSSIVDIFWGPGVGIAAVVGYFLAQGVYERRLLITALVVVWAVRLGLHIGIRNHGAEDPRYARLRKHIEDKGQSYALHSLTHVNLYQGLFMWLALAPIVFAQVATEPAELGLLAYVGTTLWLIGFLFESVADWQLRRFRNDSANAGRILDTGLWRYSRHPNYFGEVCVWWGFFLIAAEVPYGWLTAYAPVMLTYTITGMMGKALLERRMSKKHPDFADYARRTSGFIPWPPKKT